MGVDLNVWSNHKLRFSSFEEGIRMFEEMTSKKIKEWNFIKDKPLEKTKTFKDVEYFTHFELLKHNFESWNEIRIWTNFEFCDELKLLRQTLKIYPTRFRVRYSKWQQLVADRYETEDLDEIQKMKEWRKNWIQFRSYAHEITKNLKGNKVIYLNDHGYQTEEDLFFQGGNLDDGIKKLSKLVDPLELEYLELFPKDVRVTATWYYDEV